MNEYGELAQVHWAEKARARYANLDGPAEFFEALGAAVHHQITQVKDELAQSLPPDLPDWNRATRMDGIHHQAEEMVMADLVYSVDAEHVDLVETLAEKLGDLPSPSMILDALTPLRARLSEDAEREGWDKVKLSAQDEEEQNHLLDLLPLVTVPADLDETSEAELRSHLAALAPFGPC